MNLLRRFRRPIMAVTGGGLVFGAILIAVPDLPGRVMVTATLVFFMVLGAFFPLHRGGGR